MTTSSPFVGDVYVEADASTKAPQEYLTNKRRIIAGLSLFCFAALVGVVALSVSSSSSSGNDNNNSASKDTNKDTFVPASSVAVDPEDLYRTPGCPFASWFPTLPDRFGLWEAKLVQDYEEAWAEKCDDPNQAHNNPKLAGCPLGFAENDHNYNTKLGQGNSLGFVAGRLDISEDIPESVRHGLFAKTGQTLPVVARFSDFGADGSFQLARVALKIPYEVTNEGDEPVCPGDEVDVTPGSWYGEMNMLFTETLDAFPLADYKSLAKFAADSQSSAWDGLSQATDFAAIMARSALRLARDKSKPVNAKEYFSQLPYRLGCDKAMKWHLEPLVETCGWFSKPKCCVSDVDGSGKDGQVKTFAKHISECDTKFLLQVQVKDISKDWDAINDAASYWREEYITVGTITLPSQSVDNTATSESLINAAADSLGLDGDEKTGVHKLFMFHPLLLPNEHRPLGEVNSFRSHFYSQHTMARLETLQHDIYEGSSNPKPPYKMPFGQFKGDSAKEVSHLFGQ